MTTKPWTMDDATRLHDSLFALETLVGVLEVGDDPFHQQAAEFLESVRDGLWHMQVTLDGVTRYRTEPEVQRLQRIEEVAAAGDAESER